MKKVLYLSLLLFAIVGCDGSSGSSSYGGSYSGSSSDTYEETEIYSNTCGNCGGTGYYGGYTCVACKGTGELQYDVVETRSSSNVSFKGSSYYYGPCNSGCGCKGYVHAPGQTRCEGCAFFGCTTNKFGHKKIYN